MIALLGLHIHSAASSLALFIFFLFNGMLTWINYDQNIALNSALAYSMKNLVELNNQKKKWKSWHTNLINEAIQARTTRASIDVKNKRVSSRVALRLHKVVEELYITHAHISDQFSNSIINSNDENVTQTMNYDLHRTDNILTQFQA